MFQNDTIHGLYDMIAGELLGQNYDMNGSNPQLDSVKLTRVPSGAIRIQAKVTVNVWVERPERSMSVKR